MPHRHPAYTSQACHRCAHVDSDSRKSQAVFECIKPSMKLCSACGALKDMPLSERVYRCPCGLVLDRDHNAALNVLAAGRAERLNACGDQVRPAPVRAQVNEAGTHRSPA